MFPVPSLLELSTKLSYTFSIYSEVLNLYFQTSVHEIHADLSLLMATLILNVTNWKSLSLYFHHLWQSWLS